MLDLSILENNLNDQISYQDFFHAFGYSGQEWIYLRRFDDTKKTKVAENMQVELYRFAWLIPSLRRYNNEKNGIYFVVNGGGQENKCVKIARAAFMEIDDGSFEDQIEKINAFPLEPSVIIRTKKSLHTYWLTPGGDIRKYEDIQVRLARLFNADPSSKIKAKVMRLYGFNHCKQDPPVMVKLIKFDPELIYTQEQILEVLPELPDERPISPDQGEAGEDADFYSSKQKDTFLQVNEWRKSHNIPALKMEVLSDNRIKISVPCPWCDSHSEESGVGDSGIFIGTNGKRGFMCFHKHCINKHWREYRAYYDGERSADEDLKPEEFTDVDQAGLFHLEYGERVRYSQATKWLYYDGLRWTENELIAQKLSQELTERQLDQAREELATARTWLDNAAEAKNDAAVKAAKVALKNAENFRSFVLKRRSSSRIAATLTEAAPTCQIDVKELDRDPFLLNTPGGTIDLRTGELRAHNPLDYCTKITAVSMDDNGADTWKDFLNDITVGDANLERFLQDVSGLCAIGAVKREELIIAFGGGSNGKSTFFNVLFMVLGDYAWMLSAETLTTNTRKNKSPEYAELRGRRLIIAAELEEGQRLDTSTVKKLCSTDPIIAEKKFKDPFTFIPSHHVVLYTNHLPKVGTSDNGTWRRLVTVPFNARFTEGAGQIKDYAGYLFDHCAGAVLSWVVEGAKRVIKNDYQIKKPDCVEEAIEEYKEASDWLGDFLEDFCVTGPGLCESGGVLYETYRIFCELNHEYVRHKGDFVAAIEGAGFQGRHTKRGKIYYGIKTLTAVERTAKAEQTRKEAIREAQEISETG